MRSGKVPTISTAIRMVETPVMSGLSSTARQRKLGAEADEDAACQAIQGLDYFRTAQGPDERLARKDQRHAPNRSKHDMDHGEHEGIARDRHVDRNELRQERNVEDAHLRIQQIAEASLPEPTQLIVRRGG